MKIRLPASLLIPIFFYLGCDASRTYENNFELKGRIWHKDSLQQFAFKIDDTSRLYNLYINIRNSGAFQYHNIYFKYLLHDTLQNALESKLVSKDLFHPKTGRPLGTSGIGDIFRHQFLLLEQYQFPGAGSYTLEFAQMMRIDSLREVISVGARVEQAVD